MSSGCYPVKFLVGPAVSACSCGTNTQSISDARTYTTHKATDPCPAATNCGGSRALAVRPLASCAGCPANPQHSRCAKHSAAVCRGTSSSSCCCWQLQQALMSFGMAQAAARQADACSTITAAPAGCVRSVSLHWSMHSCQDVAG